MTDMTIRKNYVRVYSKYPSIRFLATPRIKRQIPLLFNVGDY